MAPEDLVALRRAVRSLEHPGLAARLTNMVGKPIELIGDVLPASASHAIATATSKGLEAALKVALRTMQHTPHAGSQLLHKALATASGAAGGAFGLATLPIELPVSTNHHAEIHRGYCTKRRRRSFRPGIGTLMRAGLCIGRTGWLGRCVSKRIFRCAGHAREECN
jgi:hypothetical protein